MSRIVELAKLYYEDKNLARRHRREERLELMAEMEKTLSSVIPLAVVMLQRRKDKRRSAVVAEHEAILTFFATVRDHELKLLGEIFGPRLIPVVEIMAKYASPSKEATASKQETLQ